MNIEQSETKIIKYDGFTTMNNHHLFNRNLSNKAKGLLSLVLALSPNWQYSITGLTTLSTDGKDAIMSELNELRAEGYFYSVSYREGGRYKTKYYFANTPELLRQEIDRIGKTESVNRKNRIGKTESVKPQLLNTNNQILKNYNNTPYNPPKGECECETIPEEKVLFEKFRKAYRGTKRGLDTEYNNFKKKHKDWREVVVLLLPAYERQCKQLDSNRAAGIFVPQPKNLQTYINQRCWEEEIQPIPIQNYATDKYNRRKEEYARAVYDGLQSARTKQNFL